jgi:hypothetical protein
MRNLIFTVLLLAFSTGALAQGQPAVKPDSGAAADSAKAGQTQPPAIKYPSRKEFDMTAFKMSVEGTIKQLSAELPNSDKVKSIDILTKVGLFNFWAAHPYIEEATDIHREWFKKIAAYLQTVAKSKNDIEVYGEAHEKTKEKRYLEKFEAAKQNYETLMQQIRPFLKKPDYLTAEEKKRLKERVAEEERRKAAAAGSGGARRRGN